MALPSKEKLRNIILNFLKDGRTYAFSAIKTRVKGELNVEGYDLKKKNRSGTQFTWFDRTENVLTDLKREGLVEISKEKKYRLTEADKKFLIGNPTVGKISTTETAPAPSTSKFSSSTNNRIIKVLSSMEADKFYSMTDFKNVFADEGLNGNQVQGIRTVLLNAGYISYPSKNQYQITYAGKKFLSDQNVES